MINTGNNVFLFDLAHCLFHHGLVAVLDEADELLGPQRLEVALHHAEHQLNRVVLGRVGDVEDPSEAEALHLFLRFFTGMYAQVIHKEANLVVAIGFAQGL